MTESDPIECVPCFPLPLVDESDVLPFIPELALADLLRAVLNVRNVEKNNWAPGVGFIYEIYRDLHQQMEEVKVERVACSEALRQELVAMRKAGEKLNWESANAIVNAVFPLFSLAIDELFILAQTELKGLKHAPVEIRLRLKNMQAYLVKSLEWFGGWIGRGVYPIISPLMKEKLGEETMTGSRATYGIGVDVKENPTPSDAVRELFGSVVPLSKETAIRLKEKGRDQSMIYYSNTDMKRKRLWLKMVLYSCRMGVELSEEEVKWMRQHYTRMEIDECIRKDELENENPDDNRWIALFLVGPIAYFNENCRKHSHCQIITAPSETLCSVIFSPSFPSAFWLSLGLSEGMIKNEASWIMPILKREYWSGLKGNENGFVEITLNYNDEEAQRECLRKGCKAATSVCEFDCEELDEEAEENAKLEEEDDPSFEEEERKKTKHKRRRKKR
jgi:hypothetical protein